MTKYGYTKEVKTGFFETLDDIEISLKEQGFGILTRIDMQEAFKKKLDKNIENYMILGACNPSLAFEAMEIETEIGLVLPCNIIVYKKKSKTFVSSIIAEVGIGFIDNPEIINIAKRADEKLKTAIDNL